MNGDHEKQESTEELTTHIIKNSKEIMTLLDRDGIKLEEVNDYKIYPIADNDTPKLSADRFEYNFSSGMILKVVWTLDDIKEIYDNITILKNEEGTEELGFKDEKIAEKYINIISNLWIEDLYKLSEQEVINKIENCEDKNIANSFKMFRNTTSVNESDKYVENKYCVNVKAKRRYIVPLTKTETGIKRINEVSNIAKQKIENYLKYESKPYIYFNFDFK